jgi:hypothetical protein
MNAPEVERHPEAELWLCAIDSAMRKTRATLKRLTASSDCQEGSVARYGYFVSMYVGEIPHAVAKLYKNAAELEEVS